MNMVWIGYHEEGVEAFKSVLEHGKKISAFITLDDNAFEKKSAGSRIYKEYCTRYKVPCYMVDTIKGEKAYELIFQSKPDLLVVLGWSEILPESILDIPPIGTVGTHASLLPHNRGSAPVNWALIHGEEVTGNTMMWLNKEVDKGEIISQAEFPITIYDTCKTLYKQVAMTNAAMLDALIDNLEKGVRTVSGIKNETDELLLPRRRPKDGLINWNQNGKDIYNFIRALTIPYPGAFSFLNGEKWLIWEAALLPVSSKLNGIEPGEILGNVYSFSMPVNGILVGTQSEVLLLTKMEDSNGVVFSDERLNDLNLRGMFGNG
ncbi:MAG: methionyl-tRNA formyltransferase [Lachnospiraceae bacterium]|nr:methionyl-tRNA formyltransferase [Lachnospiraceae bacterium]